MPCLSTPVRLHARFPLPGEIVNNNSSRSGDTFRGPGTALNAAHGLSHRILTTSQRVVLFSHPHRSQSVTPVSVIQTWGEDAGKADMDSGLRSTLELGNGWRINEEG